MKFYVLGHESYDDPGKNYGDCTVIVHNREAVIYDCGSVEHAQVAISILDRERVLQATVILSHNDSDHFNGIQYLIDRNRVSKLFTVLLLKYKKKILDSIDDGRRNVHSIGEAIKEKYSNIASLSGQVPLKDVFEDSSELPSFIKFIGPSLDYIIDAVAKDLDGREGDKVDMETVTNATSVQIQVSNGINKLFLTGDCAPLAIPESENLKKYAYIQLPHHGKADSAKALFDRTYPENGIVFFVSDNTGNSNGGSDKLDTTGHNVKNTKQRGTLLFTLDVSSNRYVGSLG